MNTIIEETLKENLEKGSVTMITLTQEPDGRYSITVCLSWSSEEYQLVTTKKKQPKYWSSLDRLVRHFNRHYDGLLPIITLNLKGAIYE